MTTDVLGMERTGLDREEPMSWVFHKPNFSLSISVVAQSVSSPGTTPRTSGFLLKDACPPTPTQHPSGWHREAQPGPLHQPLSCSRGRPPGQCQSSLSVRLESRPRGRSLSPRRPTALRLPSADAHSCPLTSHFPSESVVPNTPGPFLSSAALEMQISVPRIPFSQKYFYLLPFLHHLLNSLTDLGSALRIGLYHVFCKTSPFPLQKSLSPPPLLCHRSPECLFSDASTSNQWQPLAYNTTQVFASFPRSQSQRPEPSPGLRCGRETSRVTVHR